MSRALLRMVPVLVVLGIVTGCGEDESDTPAASQSAALKTVFFGNPLPSHPDWISADECFEKVTDELGIEGTTSGPSGLEIDDQFVLDRLNQAIATGADALIMVPIDPALYEPVMQRAKDNDILIATLNTGETTSLQDVQLGTDYTNQGAVVAENIAKRLGQQTVGILGNAPTGVHRTFVDGFKTGAESTSNVKVVTEAYDGGDPTKTADTVSRMLTAHPEINVVLTWMGTASPGIITAIKEKDLVGKVVAVTNDRLSPPVKEGLKEGTVYGTSVQTFCDMAEGAVRQLEKLKQGKRVPENIDTGIEFVTKENMGEVSAP